jgi:hypothetical protein
MREDIDVIDVRPFHLAWNYAVEVQVTYIPGRIARWFFGKEPYTTHRTFIGSGGIWYTAHGRASSRWSLFCAEQVGLARIRGEVV